MKENASAPKTVEQGRVVKGEKFQLKGTPYIIGSRDGSVQKEPEISLKKEKDFISAIEVKCVCGRTIHIDCK